MRYLILLLFVIPLVSQSATVRGQTCTVTDLENADPGCCASTMYMCSDLTVSGQSDSDKISCCNANQQCKWVTGKYSSLGNKNTCQPKNDIRCTAQTISNCIITESATHGVTLSSAGNKTRCANNYTGSCSYECYGGTWHENNNTPHTGNQCKAKCSAETKNNCRLTASNHNQTSGSCANGYPNGSCSYTCNNGTWTTPSNNTCARANNCTKGNARCDTLTLAHDQGPTSPSCKSNYTGRCNFGKCNNGSMSLTDTCKLKCSGTHNSTKCPSVDLFAHGTTQNRQCNSGYTGSGCSYTCNNGTLGGSANCTQRECTLAYFRETICTDPNSTVFTSSPKQNGAGVVFSNIYGCDCGTYCGGLYYSCSNGIFTFVRAYVRYCFIADTMITMADGTKKVIQDVKKGDKVKGVKGINTILEVKKHYARPYKGLIYSINGSRLFVTSSHPFKTTKGWKAFSEFEAQKLNPTLDIKRLKVGDILIKEDGTKEVLKTYYAELQDTKIYNFTVSGDKTYYADGYLVHNK